MLLFNQCAQLPFPWSFCHAANQKVQCGFQRYCHFYQQVYRSGSFSPLDSSQMAVTDVQLYGKLFLRKPVGFAGLLDTFSGGVSIKVHKPALRPNGAATNRHTKGSERRQTFVRGGSVARRDWIRTQSIFFS